MKVLIVGHPCATAINQQVYVQLEAQTGWEVTLIIPKHWRDEYKNVSKGERWPGFKGRIIPVPIFNNGAIILHGYRASAHRLLQQGAYDAMYVHQEPYGIATAQFARANRATRKIPLGFYSSQNIKKRYPPPFNWMERSILRSSQFAFPVTEEVADVLQAKGFRGDACILPLPLDATLYRPRKPSDAPVFFERKQDEIILGYIGRLVEEKGLRTLASALSKLPPFEWKLVVIGNGMFGDGFDRLMRDYGLAGRVIRAGFLPHSETARCLSAFDTLIVPSETQPNWKEQFGRVVVEAQACGVPVVGSDSGEIPRLIRKSGGGLVFPERDSDALAKTITRLAADGGLRAEAAQKGRAWVLEHATVEVIAAKFAMTIERAVRANRDRVVRV
jgi:L-malate glycosyltransferase